MSEQAPGMVDGAAGCGAFIVLVALNLVFWLGGIWLGIQALKWMGWL